MTGPAKQPNLLAEWTSVHSPVVTRLSSSSNRSGVERLPSAGRSTDSQSLLGVNSVHYIRNSSVGACGAGNYRSSVQSGGGVVVHRGQSMCQLEVLGRERLASISSPDLVLIGRQPPKRSLTLLSRSTPECQLDHEAELEVVNERVCEDCCDSGRGSRRQTEYSRPGESASCARQVRHSNTSSTLAREHRTRQQQQQEACGCSSTSKPNSSSCRAEPQLNKGRLGHISYSVQNCNTVCCELEMGAVRRPRLSTVDSEPNDCSECLLAETMRTNNCVALPPLEDKSPSSPPPAAAALHRASASDCSAGSAAADCRVLFSICLSAFVIDSHSLLILMCSDLIGELLE